MSVATPPEELVMAQADAHPDDVVNVAMDYASGCDSWRHGRSPSGVAAAAVYAGYLECGKGEGRVQRRIAECFKVSPQTLRQRLREFE